MYTHTLGLSDILRISFQNIYFTLVFENTAHCTNSSHGLSRGWGVSEKNHVPGTSAIVGYVTRKYLYIYLTLVFGNTSHDLSLGVSGKNHVPGTSLKIYIYITLVFEHTLHRTNSSHGLSLGCIEGWECLGKTTYLFRAAAAMAQQHQQTAAPIKKHVRHVIATHPAEKKQIRNLERV